MTCRILNLTILALVACGTARAQIASEGAYAVGSMHGIIAARSSAVGEATVAALGDPSAWNSNPATLAGAHGAGAHFITAHRSMEWNYISTDWLGAGAWIETPIVNVGVHYVKQDLGEFQQTFESGLMGDRVRVYNQTLTFNLATALAGPVAFGANIKWTQDRNVMVVPAISNDESTVDGSGVYVDLGAIASTRGLLRGRTLNDSAHIGVSVQDIGGRFAYSNISQSLKIAQWVRAGGSYSIIVGDSGTTTLRTTLAAEYSRMLNPNERQNGAYGGIGFEATLFDILSLRVGTRFAPQPQAGTNNPGSWTAFGAGVNLPLKKIGMPLPITLGIDYAQLPEVDRDIDDGKAENVLEVHVAYTGGIFGR